jgi:hypothetical protein
MLDLYKTTRTRTRKILQSVTKLRTDPLCPPHTHIISLSLSLSLQALLKVEKASTGMPIYKVPSSNQSGAPHLHSTVCVPIPHFFVPNRVFANYLTVTVCECNRIIPVRNNIISVNQLVIQLIFPSQNHLMLVFIEFPMTKKIY